MYNKDWSAEFMFSPQVGSNKIDIQSPRFSQASSYILRGKHSFNWTGLTAGEKLTFELFLGAFGGNMARPFAMCIIHGQSPSGVTNKVMTTRLLIIDEQSVTWSVDRDTERHGISFSATELIPV